MQKFIFLLSICVLLTACKPEKEEEDICEGCTKVPVSGIVVKKSIHGTVGVANYPIQVTYSNEDVAGFGWPVAIHLGYTDQNGVFNFQVPMSWQMFLDNYVLIEFPWGPSLASHFHVRAAGTRVLDELPKNGVRDIVYTLYDNAAFRIKFKNSSGESLQELRVIYYADGYEFISKNLEPASLAGDPTLEYRAVVGFPSDLRVIGSTKSNIITKSFSFTAEKGTAVPTFTVEY